MLAALCSAVEAREPVPTLVTQTGHSGDVTKLVFSTDGHFLLMAGSDRVARPWSVDTGREIRRFRAVVRGPNYVAFTAAFSADGRSVYTATDTIQAG